MKLFYEHPVVNLPDKQLMEQQRVKNLVEYERYCADYGHKPEQASCWFADGQFFSTWFKGLFADYQNAKPTHHESPVKDTDKLRHMTHHRVNDSVVWLNGSRAIAEVMAFLDFRTKMGTEWVDLQCWVRFHYRVEKRDGRWGIVYFEGIYEKDRVDPVFGDSDFRIPRELLQKYHAGNWNMALRRDIYEGGLCNYDDWKSPDRPEGIRKLYEESSRWLDFEL